MKQTILILTIALTFLSIGSRCEVEECDSQNYIIPYDALDQAFDQGIDAVRSQEQLVALVQSPTIDNVKNYLISLAPFSAPFFVMAVISFILFIASIVQVICFNTCGKECCGNQINSNTYNVCCLRTMVGSFLILSFLVLAIAIAAMIVNSDLQMAIDFTSCNTQNIIDETYNGNTNETIPWSGINNFQADIDIFSINIQNTVPYLITYFSTSTSAYNQIIDDATGSSYANSQIFSTICATSTQTISCPFPDSSTCTSPYNPVFNVQFCNQSFTDSAANLIKAEMDANSTAWRENIINIGNTLTTLDTDEAQVEVLVTQVTDFTSSVGEYEETLLNGFSQAEDIMNNIEIAFYVFYSFVILCSLLSITSVCCVYYCLNYKCRYLTYFLWYIYAVLSILFFVGAGIFFGTSIFTYDTCTAYPYYFTNQTNFNSLTFGSNQLQGIFQTCFYQNSTSIFKSFNDTSILNQFGDLQDEYILATPSTTFFTTVTTIEATMNSYRLNPNTVTISSVTDSQQPATAMTELLQFGNFSNNATTQSCQLTKDFFTFDVANCYPYLTNQPVSENDCIVLFSPDLTNIVNGRVTEFDTRNCEIDGNTYEDRVNAMVAYGDNIVSMVNDLAPITDENKPIQQYEDAYFNYYTDVYNFFDDEIQQIFSSFFDPYLSLESGSNCGFITASMNGIVDIACNQLFPYLNAFSALNITCSAFIFIMFIISYFLTTRFQFYQFLEGNYQNYGVETKTTKDLQQAYDFDTGRQIELLPNGDRVY